MRKTVAEPLPEPRVIEIPSSRARSVEAALEALSGDPRRRFDAWILRFSAIAEAVALRRRLDEESATRGIALVALVDGFERLDTSTAMTVAAEAMGAGVKAVFPASIPPASLDVVVGGIIDRQRELAAYAAVKRRRQAIALQEAKLCATENTLARKLYGALTPLTGHEIAPTRSLRRAAREFERLYVSRVLAEVEGNPERARKILEVSRSSFYRLLAAHDLQHLIRRLAEEPTP